MKISIVVSNSLRKDPRVIKQIKIAMANGYDVQFVGYYDDFYDEEFLENLGCKYDIVNMGNKYVGHLKSPIKKVIRLFYRPLKAAKYIYKFKPDIIHTNDYDTLGLGYLAAKKCGARLIYDSHEIFAENGVIAHNKLLKKYIMLREKCLTHKIDKMISVSNAAADYFRDIYKIDRPTVITNCPMRNTQPLKEKADKFEVVYQGMMYPGRGYEEFTLAGKYITDEVRLVLRGYGSIETQLKEMMKQENLAEKVVFSEPVEVSQLVCAASSSHVGVVLTRPVSLNFKMSVSNKVFEYAAAGLPVILSDVPEHRYLNDKFNFGIIIDEVTPQAIAAAISELYEDSEKYKILADNAKKMAEEMVWENEAKKLLEIYKTI